MLQNFNFNVTVDFELKLKVSEFPKFTFLMTMSFLAIVS